MADIDAIKFSSSADCDFVAVTVAVADLVAIIAAAAAAAAADLETFLGVFLAVLGAFLSLFDIFSKRRVFSRIVLLMERHTF
jgi:hypothetical protein